MTESDFKSDFFWDPASPISAEELTRKRMQSERQKLENRAPRGMTAQGIGKQKAEESSATA